VTRRATARGAERTPLEGARADVLVCGASFAGLAVARELAGAGARVLVVDRYEIGERATSACAAPTPWLRAMGVESAILQEIPRMRFATPHGAARWRLPWSWSSFDYRKLCLALWAQCGDARFETAKVEGREPRGPGGEIAVRTDRGTLRARFVVDALGWRRVLARDGYQPPDAPLSRGLEVHPHDGRGVDLEVWVDRSLARRGYGWSVPAGAERRIGVGSYEPRDHVKEPTRALAAREGAEAVRWQGNWFPHRLRAASDGEVFYVGDSAGHCFPLSGEGIRTAFYFGIAAGREIRSALAGEVPPGEALRRYGAFSAARAPAFALALALQRTIPALPPRLLTALLRAMGRRRLVDRVFGFYLEQAPPSYALSSAREAEAGTDAAGNGSGPARPSITTVTASSAASSP